MKKTLLTLLGAACMASASAWMTAPVYYTSDFMNDMIEEKVLPDGYIFSGVEGTVPNDYKKYFKDYSATNPFLLLGWGSNAGCWTPAALQGADKEVIPGEQWMITPPITIQDSQSMFCFGVVQTGLGGTQKFKLYISESGGADVSDFVELTNSSLSGSAQNIATASRRVVVEGYQGKTVRFAMVSTGNKGGMIGFYDIYAGQYYCQLGNAPELEVVALPAQPTIQDFKVSYKISTPVQVEGFTAVLRTESGFETTYNYTGKITKSTVREVNFVFPQPIDMQGQAAQNYTLTITPNQEGFKPTVITGRLVTAPEIYDANAFIEEYTSQTCGWCPRGIAFMNYYKDLYNGQGKGKVIPVMIHGTMNSSRPDPMRAPSNYESPFVNDLSILTGGQPGFPMCLMNRTSVGDPSNIDVAGVMASKSFAKMSIVKAGPDATDPNMIRVRTANTLSFSTGSYPVYSAVILMEDDVQGKGTSYNQDNYFYQYSMSSIVSSYGAALEPYFTDFASPAPKTILAADMHYPEVARAITNYYGDPMPRTWVADEALSFEQLIEIPSSVMKIENCSVITILMGATGQVIASDIMPYSEWEASLEASVGTVSDSDFRINPVRCAEGLSLKLTADANVEVWSVDGARLFAGQLRAGENVLPINRHKTVVVKAVSNGSVATAKVIL